MTREEVRFATISVDNINKLVQRILKYSSFTTTFLNVNKEKEMLRLALTALLMFGCLAGCGDEANETTDLTSFEQAAGKASNNKFSKITKQLNASIKDADEQYSEYANFINSLLDNGIVQGQSIICCWSRSQLLKEVAIPKQDEAAALLQKLVSGQKYIKFYIETEVFYLHVIPSIPYGSRTWRLDTYSKHKTNDEHADRLQRSNYKDVDSESKFKVTVYPDYFSDLAKTYLYECDWRYRAPIPGGDKARRNELRTYASLYVGSVRRLKRYDAKIPVLEETASKALAAGAVLTKLRKDVEIDLLDPSTAEGKIKEYQKFLNRAAQDLAGARLEMATDPEVTNKEVDDALKQM
jgi:hypothetical protein